MLLRQRHHSSTITHPGSPYLEFCWCFFFFFFFLLPFNSLIWPHSPSIPSPLLCSRINFSTVFFFLKLSSSEKYTQSTHAWHSYPHQTVQTVITATTLFVCLTLWYVSPMSCGVLVKAFKCPSDSCPVKLSPSPPPSVFLGFIFYVHSSVGFIKKMNQLM